MNVNVIWVYKFENGTKITSREFISEMKLINLVNSHGKVEVGYLIEDKEDK